MSYQSQYGNQTQYGNQPGTQSGNQPQYGSQPVTQYGNQSVTQYGNQPQYGSISSIPQQYGTVSGIQSQQYGTVSQGQFVGPGGAKGESIPGSQKVIDNADALPYRGWWLGYTDQEKPLPNCIVPVTSAPSPWPCEFVLRV